MRLSFRSCLSRLLAGLVLVASNFSHASDSVESKAFSQADTAASEVVEFYNTNLDHFFITGNPNEARAVDNGAAGAGWVRTGFTFKSGGDVAVCRFYGSQSPGPNSHFYTASSGECNFLKKLQETTPVTQKRWNYESLDFLSTLPVNRTCSNGTVPVYQAYNDGFRRGIDSNHRFSVSLAAIQQVVDQGWINEGVVMCAPAGSGAANVVAVTPDRLMFGKMTRFTVTGQNLDQGISIFAPSCSGMVELAGGTAAQKVFTCTPSVVGALPFLVRSMSGATLLSAPQFVPLPQVSLKTSMGDILLELYPANAPATVRNFLQYVEEGFYSDKIFHRVISDFVIQGGGYNAAMQLAPVRPPIPLEVGLSNLRGTVAMARYAALDSADSQFFINVVDNPFLDSSAGGYAVFGKVVGGMDVVDRIKLVPVHAVNGMSDVPIVPVVIQSAVQTK